MPTYRWPVCCAPAGHVPGELLRRILDDGGLAEILLDLDDGEADLDVYAPVARDWRLQLDVKVVLCQAKPAGEEQLANVGLYSRFGADPIPIGETIQKGLQLIIERCVCSHSECVSRVRLPRHKARVVSSSHATSRHLPRFGVSSTSCRSASFLILIVRFGIL